MIKKFPLFILVVLGYVIFILFPSNDLSSDGFYESDDKLWAHRVNNLKDIKPFSKEFKGFELDVFYNKNLNKFDVKHHGKYSELSLGEYFSYSQDYSLKYWIDFKNLNENNVNDAIILLDSLSIKYSLKYDLIVESKNIELLSKFKQNDFSICYWLPSFNLIRSFYQIHEIKANLLKFKPHVISMPYSSVVYYSIKFPNYPIHCWTNDMISQSDKVKIQKLSKNENVKVILTDFKYNFLK